MKKNEISLKTSRQIKSEATINKIINSTEKILKKYGMEALTVSNICKDVNISNGTFFHYFKSKTYLLAYFLNEGFRTYLQKNNKNFSTICSASKDFKESIITIYLEYINYCEFIGIDFISQYYIPQNPSLNRYNENNDDDIVSMYILEELNIAYANKLIKTNCDIDEIEKDLCIIIKGIIFDWCLSQGKNNMKIKTKQLLSMYLNAISI